MRFGLFEGKESKTLVTHSTAICDSIAAIHPYIAALTRDTPLPQDPPLLPPPFPKSLGFDSLLRVGAFATLEKTDYEMRELVEKVRVNQPAPKYHTKMSSSVDSPGAQTLVFAAFESFFSCEFRASIAQTPFCAMLWRSPTPRLFWDYFQDIV